MRKIALVANTTWNIYNFRKDLIRRFMAQGDQVIIISPTDKYLDVLSKSLYTKHIPLQHLSPQSKNPINDFFLFRELYKIYKKETPDLILHYTIKPNIYGSIAARKLEIPCISTVTGLGYTFLNKGFSSWLVKPLYKYAFRKNCKIIFHNTDDKNLFVDLNLAGKNNVEVIKGSGVNTTYFQPQKKDKNNGKFIFLFIGRLLYDKGIVEFAQAAKQVKEISTNVECWVVGELNAENPSNIPEKKLVQWIEKEFIHYWGKTNDIREFIKKADVIVLPSYREGMPRAVLEGMSMGKPIITTDTAGCRETVDEGKNGLLVPVKDAHSLAAAMIKIYNLDQEAVEKMGEASRTKVLKEFDEKIINQRYLDLIEQLF